MKSNIILISLIIGFLSCTKSNNEPTDDSSFEPIEITFSEDLFTDCNQTVSVDNVNLTYRPISENEPSANTIGDCGLFDNSLSIEQRVNHPFNGLYRLFLSSHLEIDISRLSGYSELRLTIEDNCSVGCTGANLYVDNEIVEKQFNTTSNPTQEELIFDLGEISAQKVTVYSFEGILYKINID